MSAAASEAGRPGRLRRALPPLALFVALLVAWEVAVTALAIPDYILPAPSRVWAAFIEVRALLPAHIATTLTEALGGLALAIGVAVPVAALVATFESARRAVLPLLVVSQNIPMIVLAPLLVVWFGFGITPKLLVVALIGFFPIAVSTTDGLLNADRELIELIRGMGASRGRVLGMVLIPSAVPSFFAGLKISATYAVLAAVIGEWVGASSGLGLFITRAQTAFRTDRVLVAVVVIALISVAMFMAMQLLARLAMPYRSASQEENRS
jgi:ABC-type nitrate/sulfonate/bicarbonate transport system permease component